ncbi:MAG: hypothetical protein ACRCYE_07305 [Sarcina sp.]
MGNKSIYKNIFDEIYHGIFVTDKNGIILYSNKVFGETYNLDIESIIRKSFDLIESFIKKGDEIISIVSETEYVKNDLKISRVKKYLEGFEKILLLTIYNNCRKLYKAKNVLNISQS